MAAAASPFDIVESASLVPGQESRKIASPFDIVASDPPQDAEKPGLLHDVWQEGIVNPAKQVAGGYFRSAAGGAHLLGNATEALGKVTGVKPRGFFREAERYYDQQADEMSGGRHDIASQIYRGLGAAPGEIAKYTVAAEALGPIAGMGVVDALSASDKGPKAAVVAGVKGALTGKALGLMSPASLPARAAGGAAMFGGQAAVEGGSPYDIVASSITGGVMGATSRHAEEQPKVAIEAAPSGPIEEMPTSALSRLLAVESDPAKRAVLAAEAQKRGMPPVALRPQVRPAEVSARAIEQTPDYPALFEQADKWAARRARQKPTVPETGIPENVARVLDARERLAQQFGKSFADLSNSDRLAIDDLIRQGYTGAPAPPEQAPASPGRVSMPPPSSPQQRAPVAQRTGQENQPQVTAMPPPGIETPAPVPVPEPKGATLVTDEARQANAAARPEPGPAPEPRGSGEGAPLPGSDQSGDRARFGSGTFVRIPGEAGGFEARYALRELADVQPSHDPVTLQRNPAYLLQNDRDYSEPRNSERILKQVSGFDPAYLTVDSPDATNGAPVVTSNGNVLGGNSRTITLARVYRERPDAALAYRDSLIQKAQQFGIDPNQVAQMREPILVREVTKELTPPELQSAITDLNKTGTAALTPAERALADSRRITPAALDFISQKIDEQGAEGTLAQALQGDNGREIVQKLVDEGVIGTSEKPQYLSERGLLTEEGKNRISRLLLGRLFTDSAQLDRTPPELRNKLERITAPLSRLVPESQWDIGSRVREALDLLEDARQHGIRNLDDLRAQQGMFGDAAYSPEAFAIAKTLQQSPLKAVQAFRQYASDAAYAQGGNLLGNAPSATEAFQTAFPDTATGPMPPPSRGPGMPPPGEHGSVAADLLTAPLRAVGLDKFLAQDVIPAVGSAGRKASGAIDDIRTLLAPQTRSSQAAKAAGMIRERGATLAQARDRAVVALANAKKYFDARTPEYNLHFIDAVETGRADQLPSTERQFAQTMRELIDQRSEDLKNLGLLKTFYENYFPHLWRDSDAAAHWLQNWFAKRPMAGSEAYRKQRTYPTMMDGINDPDFHMVPAFTNPVEFVTAKLGEMDRSITAHQLIEELKAAGDLQPLPNGEKPPAGTKRIDDRIATGYVSPEPLATVINSHLAPGLSRSPLFQVWRGLNNTMNMIDLSLSYYHGLTTTLNSSLSDMALGLKQAAAGKPIQGAASVARGFTPFASVVQDVLKGTKLLKVWDGAPAPDPMTGALVDAIKAGGGRARQDLTYSQNYANGFMQALRSSNLPGAAIRLPFAALEKTMAPLMEYMVPRAKLGVFAKRAQMEIERNPNMTPEQARETFGKIWDSGDNRFGQFVNSNLMMNRLAKDLMMAVVGRPGWNIGTVREVGGGMADLARAAVAPVRGAKPELTDRAAFTAALFLGGAAINGLVNYALTGTTPQAEDYLAPRDGGSNEDGRPSRIVLPTYLSKDLYSYWTRPLATLKAKAAPALTVAGDLLTNRDFQNRKIVGDGGIGLGEYAKEAVTPYAIQGVEKNLERDEPASRVVLPLIGVMPAGRHIGKSKAEELMAQYEQEAMPNTRAPQSERNQLKNRITGLLRSGKPDDALRAASEAYAAGRVTDEDINHAIDRAQYPPLVADFKRLTLDQALNVMAIATPAERQQLVPELAERLDRSFNTLPPQEQGRIEGRIAKLGLIP